MALAKLQTFALVGIDAVSVEAEVDVAPVGLPNVILVGLAETSVKESLFRVKARTESVRKEAVGGKI